MRHAHQNWKKEEKIKAPSKMNSDSGSSRGASDVTTCAHHQVSKTACVLQRNSSRGITRHERPEARQFTEKPQTHADSTQPRALFSFESSLKKKKKKRQPGRSIRPPGRMNGTCFWQSPRAFEKEVVTEPWLKCAAQTRIPAGFEDVPERGGRKWSRSSSVFGSGFSGKHWRNAPGSGLHPKAEHSDVFTG